MPLPSPIKYIAGTLSWHWTGIFLIVLLTPNFPFLGVTTQATKSGQYILTEIQTLSAIKSSGSRGASWYDYDSDGYQDLFLAGGEGADRLLHNNKNGTFTDVTKKSGLANNKSTSAGVFADFNNDGCPDLFLAKGHYTNTDELDKLYQGNCDGTFSEVSQNLKTNTGHSQGSAWGDYDNDGYLDLYVAKTGAIRSETDFDIIPNILYHNNRDGTFSDVTAQASVDGVNHCPNVRYGVGNKDTLNPASLPGWKTSFQPLWFDYNGDGLADLFVTNDGGVSQLYRNDGAGKFTNVTSQAGMCVLGSGMGVDAGDYDGDGLQDLYVTNVGYGFLWHNNGNGTFEDRSIQSKVANYNRVGWGVQFIDLDNDGYLDLYISNGSIFEGGIDRSINDKRKKITSRKDALYKNTHQSSFEDISELEMAIDRPKLGLAAADYNNDGFMDLMITEDTIALNHTRSTNYLYRGAVNANRWLTLRLIGTSSNRDAIGSKITVTADGLPSQVREVRAGSSFLSQSSLWPTFGLGKTSLVKSITINWPSGTKQILKNITVDQLLTVTEDK